MDIGALRLKGILTQTNANGITVGSGTTGQRPTAAAGGIRFNTDTNRLEAANSTAWANVGGGDVSSVNLTGAPGAITVAGGPITSSGTFTLTLAGELAGVNSIATLGFVQRTGAGTYNTVQTLPIANGGTGATTVANARAALSAPGIYRAAFTNATLIANTLTLTHNLGQQFVEVVVSDNANFMIQPDNINMTNATTATVDLASFLTGMTGTWNAVVIG